MNLTKKKNYICFFLNIFFNTIGQFAGFFGVMDLIPFCIELDSCLLLFGKWRIE